MDDLPLSAFESAATWEAFLEREGAISLGVWLKIAKKGTGVSTVTYSDALDVALCHGWIDSQKGAVDATWFKQRFTPRKPRSKWSRINVARAEALLAAGRMRAAGVAEVDAAKSDGRWAAAYAGARTIEVPPDLRAALDAEPQAAAFFAELDGTNRYAVLYRLHQAQRPETRARRLAQFVDMLRDGRRLHERSQQRAES